MGIEDAVDVSAREGRVVCGLREGVDSLQAALIQSGDSLDLRGGGGCTAIARPTREGFSRLLGLL